MAYVDGRYRCNNMVSAKAPNGHHFGLVANNYFTKWVETSSYAKLTKAQVTPFVRNNIIRWYGLPQSIITDNAKISIVNDGCFVHTIQDLSRAVEVTIKMSKIFYKRWQTSIGTGMRSSHSRSMPIDFCPGFDWANSLFIGIHYEQSYQLR